MKKLGKTVAEGYLRMTYGPQAHQRRDHQPCAALHFENSAAAGNGSAGMPPIFMIARCLCVVAAVGFAPSSAPKGSN